MDISVIVPIYGVEKYIEKCLRSLFTQTMTEGVEFILVNDCTKDRSMEIAREVIAEFSSLTIRIIEHSKNRNIAATRQTGVDAAIGDYIIQIDSDDWCEPTMLEELYSKVEEDNGIDIVMCGFYIHNGGEVLERKYSASNDNNIENILSIARPDGINTQLWNKLIRRSLFVENNIIYAEGDKCKQDFLNVVELLYFAKKVSYVDSYLMNYFNRPNSITADITDEKLLISLVIIKKIGEFAYAHNIEEPLSEFLLKLKLAFKFFAIKFSRGAAQKKSIKELPEVDKYIISNFKYGLHNKIAYWLAVNNCRYLANIIFDLVIKVKGRD